MCGHHPVGHGSGIGLTLKTHGGEPCPLPRPTGSGSATSPPWIRRRCRALPCRTDTPFWDRRPVAARRSSRRPSSAITYRSERPAVSVCDGLDATSRSIAPTRFSYTTDAGSVTGATMNSAFGVRMQVQTASDPDVFRTEPATLVQMSNGDLFFRPNSAAVAGPTSRACMVSRWLRSTNRPRHPMGPSTMRPVSGRTSSTSRFPASRLKRLFRPLQDCGRRERCDEPAGDRYRRSLR